MAKKNDSKLLNELREELTPVIGERGDSEGAVDVVRRLIRESRSTGKLMPLPKKGYIGWIVSRLQRGKRNFIFNSLSERRSDAIQDYLDAVCTKGTWDGHRRADIVQARVHKVTEIKVAE